MVVDTRSGSKAARSETWPNETFAKAIRRGKDPFAGRNSTQGHEHPGLAKGSDPPTRHTNPHRPSRMDAACRCAPCGLQMCRLLSLRRVAEKTSQRANKNELGTVCTCGRLSFTNRPRNDKPDPCRRWVATSGRRQRLVVHARRITRRPGCLLYSRHARLPPSPRLTKQS